MAMATATLTFKAFRGPQCRSPPEHRQRPRPARLLKLRVSASASFSVQPPFGPLVQKTRLYTRSEIQWTLLFSLQTQTCEGIRSGLGSGERLAIITVLERDSESGLTF